MTKLDWRKGYTLDPARVRSVEDFSTPDELVTKKAKKSPSLFAQAMKARRAAEVAFTQADQTFDQWTLLAALGVKKGALKMQERAAILAKLRHDGVLLPTGQPNPQHPKVKEVSAAVARKKLKARVRGKAKRWI